MKPIVFIIFLLICFSCKTEIESKKTNIDSVTVLTYDMRTNKLNYKDSRQFEIYLKSNIKHFEYQFEPKDSNFKNLEPFHETLDIYEKNDSIIKYNGDTCSLTGKFEYLIDNNKYLVKRYYYDKKFMSDEESNIFICDEFGILEITSVVWGNTSIYQNKKIPNKLTLTVKDLNFEDFKIKNNLR